MPYILIVLALVILGVSTPFISSKIKSDTPLALVEPTSIEADPKSISTTTAQENNPTQTDEKEVSTEPVKQETQNNVTTPPPVIKEEPTTVTTPTPSAPAAPLTTYADGTYQASKTYRTPDGTYTMYLAATIKNDIITSTTLTFDSKGARDGYSKRFSGAYQGSVLGKDLEKANPSRIGGASLTTNAFNDALSTIRNQAS